MSTSKNTPKDHYDGRKGEIMKMGYLKKLKTMKKKYFILRGESSDASARLEYYDNEKKWRNSQPPKRTISLKTCFNINRRKDTKHKYVIALYTKDDCFCIVLDSEEELQDWLKVLLKLQTGEECVDGEQPKPNFEHVWKVTLQEKGLGDSKNLVGPYHVCLTDQTLTLVKITEDDLKPETLEFPLIYIRSCGVTGSFFYIEVGRQTVTGAGALWMLTEDANIAKNMNEVIFSAFSVQQKDQKDSNPHRKRSSSATESSKPASVLQRRQTHGPSKPLVSAGGYSAVPVVSSLVIPAHSRATALHCVPRPPSQRRHSVSAMSSSSVLGSSTMVQHQRTNSIPLSPYSESSESFNGPSTTVPIVHQRTKSCPISETSVLGSLTGQTSPPEPQRNTNSLYPTHRDRISSQSSIDFAHSHAGEGSDVRRSSISGRRTSAIMKSSATGTRERSDSMPSRNRTTSEGGHHYTAGILPRIPYHGSRPHSMHSRGLSHSPPAASGHCSTDSVGSLASIDDGELDLAPSATSPRYGHSSTPDEPAIMEENCSDYCHWSQENGEDEKVDGGDYVSMERPPPSLSLPIHVTGVQRKVSAPASLKSCSPLHSFPDVCSPCGSSPLETGNYLPMSPGENARRVTVHGIPAGNHSRDGSLAEETVDGYVPMAPNPTDDGYVDMEPLPGHRFHGEDCHHSDMSPGSSCSFTSGTPSTDLRFSEYHLEKVSSYLTPSEEDELSLAERPSRTYSFGSQSETTKGKGKAEVSNGCESGRVRAFSVGSKWGRPRNLAKETHKVPSRSHVLPQSSKSSSAPLLSSSWSGTSRHAQSLNDPMADLMEIDFTENKKKKKGACSKFRVAPVAESSSQLSADMKGFHTVTSSADSGYMDMSSKSPSGVFPKMQNGCETYSASPPSLVSGVNIFGKSPPKSSPAAGLEFTGIKSFFSSTEMIRTEPKNARLAKPAVVSSGALKTIGEKPDVKPQKFPTTSSANPNVHALFNKLHASGKSLDYVDMRSGRPENVRGKECDRNYVEMGGRNARKSARQADSDGDAFSGNGNRNEDRPEGYVEMSFGGKSAKKVPEGTPPVSDPSDDYMPMSGVSRPIAIRGSAVTPAARTPPKVPATFPGSGNHAGPFDSIRRNGRRKSRKKNERRGSKEMVTTPTGSTSTIFPMSLSSPTSPKRKTNRLTDLKEGSTPSFEDSLYEEMTPGTDVEDKSVENALSDRFERFLSVTDSNDYVNYSPRNFAANVDDCGDYACVEPTENSDSRKIDVRQYSEESETGIDIDASRRVPSIATAHVSTDAQPESVQKTKRPERGDDTTIPGPGSSQISSGKTNPRSPKGNAWSLDEEKPADGSPDGSQDGSGAAGSVSGSSGTRRSEKSITYASLDLGPSGSEGEESGRSPRNFRNPSAGDETTGYSFISASPGVTSESFNYVKIDFEKSGSLRGPESFGKKIHY